MRLIDADVLFDVLYHAWGTEMDAGPASEFMEMINNAPTIASPPNAPITLEDLRKLDGEPVWLVTKTYGRWALITCMTKEYVWLTSHDGEERYCISDCGSGFLAYRRKPEEDEKR